LDTSKESVERKNEMKKAELRYQCGAPRHDWQRTIGSARLAATIRYVIARMSPQCDNTALLQCDNNTMCRG